MWIFEVFLDVSLYKQLQNWLFPLHNERYGVSNHRCFDCLLNRLFRRRLKKTTKLRVIGLCEGNSPVTGDLPAQRASNTENVCIWWRHHAQFFLLGRYPTGISIGSCGAACASFVKTHLITNKYSPLNMPYMLNPFALVINKWTLLVQFFGKKLMYSRISHVAFFLTRLLRYFDLDWHK